MDANRWKKVKTLFEQALKLDRSDREIFLKNACTDDNEVFQEVLSLLKADDDPMDILEGNAGEILNIPGSVAHENEVVGHYRIIESIGSGGMGEVYLADDTKLNRRVALKFLPAYLSMDQTYQRRFLQEARAAAKLTHPNIITIHEISEFRNCPYMVMEFVAGKTLDERTAEKRIAVDEAVNIMIQVCQGLKKAHEGGVIHRDIKPANIMVTDDGQVKILDFGIARAAETTRLTTSGAAIGTASYMSPEQCRGEEVDNRSDLFSAGVVFYEMLTGHSPFRRDNYAASIHAVIHDEPPPLTRYLPELGQHWIAIVAKALQKNSVNRYQNAPEFLNDLRSPLAVSPLPETTSIATASIAVFPFRNLSPDASIEYLSDGMCDDIIYRLAKIRTLKVASRAALSRVKDVDEDTLAATRKLGMDNILEGSIRKLDENIRFNAQLTRVSDGVVIWSEVFDRTMKDILTLQSEIAEQVAAALNLRLSGQEEQTVVRKLTANAKAYDLYMRGKFHFKRRDKESIEKAMDRFSEAIDEDEKFAPAYAQLAVACILYQTYGYNSGETLITRAYELATKAVDLEPGSSEAHLALYHVLRGHDIQRAIVELRTAIGIDPDNPEFHHFLAHAYMNTGRYENSIREDLLAISLDPFADIYRAQLCRVYFFLGQKEEMERELSQLFKTSPRGAFTWQTRGWIQWHKRQWAEAAESFERSLEINKGNFYTTDYLADCYLRLKQTDRVLNLLDGKLHSLPEGYPFHARLGQLYALVNQHERSAKHFETARRMLNEENEKRVYPNSSVYHYNYAHIHALENDIDNALEHLSLAAKQGYRHYADLLYRPDWDSLRERKEFEQIIDDMKRSVSNVFQTGRSIRT